MGFYTRTRYRVGQFWRGLTARVTPHELALAEETLTPQAYERFLRMPVDAQRHSFTVLNAIHAQGIHDPDLDAAALLHDVGKLAAVDGGVKLNLWMRGPLTLVEAITPQRLSAMGSTNPQDGWRYSVNVHFEHPGIGAEWAADDGCNELTCWLIRQHQNQPGESEYVNQNAKRMMLLKALQAADNVS